MRGFAREDGLFDIEGHLTDRKPFDFQVTVGPLRAAGEPVHEMWVRLTIDSDLVVRDAVASTDQPAVSRMLTKSIGPAAGASPASSANSGASWVQATVTGAPVRAVRKRSSSTRHRWSARSIRAPGQPLATAAPSIGIVPSHEHTNTVRVPAVVGEPLGSALVMGTGRL